MIEQIQETLSITNHEKLKEIEAKYNNMGSGGGKVPPKGFSAEHAFDADRSDKALSSGNARNHAKACREHVENAKPPCARHDVAGRDQRRRAGSALERIVMILAIRCAV